jgi:hypothetical protein
LLAASIKALLGFVFLLTYNMFSFLTIVGTEQQRRANLCRHAANSPIVSLNRAITRAYPEQRTVRIEVALRWITGAFGDCFGERWRRKYGFIVVQRRGHLQEILA